MRLLPVPKNPQAPRCRASDDVPNANAVTVQVSGSEVRSANLDRISVKKNGYGIAMAAIVTKQNLPGSVKSPLEQELTKQGFHIGSDAVLVNVEIIKFFNDSESGFFSGDAHLIYPHPYVRHDSTHLVSPP
jgi:uncharacterized lipoprotein YajG